MRCAFLGWPACVALSFIALMTVVGYRGWPEGDALNWIGSAGALLGGLGSAAAAGIAVYIAYDTKRDARDRIGRIELESARRALEITRNAKQSAHLMRVYYMVPNPQGSVDERKQEISAAIHDLSHLIAASMSANCSREVSALNAELRELKWSFTIIRKKENFDAIKKQADSAGDAAERAESNLLAEIERLEAAIKPG